MLGHGREEERELEIFQDALESKLVKKVSFLSIILQIAYFINPIEVSYVWAILFSIGIMLCFLRMCFKQRAKLILSIQKIWLVLSYLFVLEYNLVLLKSFSGFHQSQDFAEGQSA